MDRPWVREYDPGVRSTLDYPAGTLPQLFDATVERVPDRVATVFHDARLRYRDLKRQVDAFAGGLIAAGIRPGDRVAVMLPNVPQFVVAFFGALRAGAVVVPTNPLFTPHELEHQLVDAGAVAIVTLNRFFDPVQTVLPSTSIRTVIVTGVGQALPRRLKPLYALKQWREGVHAVRPGGIVRRFDDLLSASPVAVPARAAADDVAVLQYTGGTTGGVKGAMLTHRNLIANAVQGHEWQQGVPVPAEPVVLCATPFFHVYGLTIGMNLAIVSGATMLLVPRFIPSDIAHVAHKYQPHYFPGVPTMYVALAGLPRAECQFGSIEVCISGAAPLAVEVQRQFQEVSGARVLEGYGLTEASPVTHCNPIGSGGRQGTIGVPFPDTDAMVTDPETWEPVPPGEIGELTVRGPQVMKGYWNRPEETAAVLRDGWLHTGDMAVMDEDGYFRVVDRKKDVIIAGGFNIYPREVEEVLYTHPQIQDAAVVGVPNEYRGETVKAVVVPRDGSRPTAESIISFCRQQLAPYKVPKIVEFRDDLPRTLVGKVLRRKLREEF